MIVEVSENCAIDMRDVVRIEFQEAVKPLGSDWIKPGIRVFLAMNHAVLAEPTTRERYAELVALWRKSREHGDVAEGRREIE